LQSENDICIVTNELTEVKKIALEYKITEEKGHILKCNLDNEYVAANKNENILIGFLVSNNHEIFVT